MIFLQKGCFYLAIFEVPLRVMRKAALIIVGAIIILMCAYLWYARASIYRNLGERPIFAPSDFKSYSIGDASLTPRTYVAIGDSVTSGVGVATYTESYPYRIATNLSRDTQSTVELIPFAIPGIRSEYVMGYFLDPVIAVNPDIITLLIGINDIHGNVRTLKFKEHYQTILATLTEKTDAKIYVINIPYIGTEDLIRQPYRLYFNSRTQQYNEVIKDLASQYNVTYVDLYSSNKKQSLDTAYYAGDFFHPNAAGYSLWAQSIYANFSN